MLPATLLFIADRDDLGEKLFPVLKAALSGGCRWVLLRGVKTRDKASLHCALKAKALCDTYRAALFVSHAWPIATRIKADGLHLSAAQNTRKHKARGMRLGQSCHDEKEIRKAERAGADYIFLSPVFPTKSKPGYGPALGLRKLKALVSITPLPVVALGGITPRNAAACLKAGAQAVAVMGGLSRARNPEKQAKMYVKSVADAKK